MRTPEQTLAHLDEIAGRFSAPGPWPVGMSEAASVAAASAAAIEAGNDLIALVRKLLDDNAYLHTVAQGVAHYTRCCPELPCLRCERDALRAKYADALTVLRWARISDHPMYGLGMNQGLSTDAEARAALGRIRAGLEAPQ